MNVSHNVFKFVLLDLLTAPRPTTFIFAYMKIPPSLEQLPILELAMSCSFSVHRHSFQWKLHKLENIVHVLPLFFDIPPRTSPLYIHLCWSEILLYIPFMNFQMTLDSQTWKLSLHGNPFVWATLPSLLNETMHPIYIFMMKLLLLMKFMVPPLWKCLNGNSSINSALETTYYLMILTFSVTANLTPNTISAKHTYFYTCKTQRSHSLT